MSRRAAFTSLAALVLLLGASAPAFADSPTPTPSLRPTPPAPNPAAPLAPSATPLAGATPATNAPATSAPAPGDAQATEVTTLLARIEAMRAYVQVELDALAARGHALEEDKGRLQAQLNATARLIADEQARLDALLRDAYRSSRASPLERILDRGSLLEGIIRASELAKLGEEQRRLVARLAALNVLLQEQRLAAERDASDLAAVTEATTAKREVLAGLDARARLLVDAQQRGGDAARVRAEIDVLTQLADEQAKSSRELAELVAKIVPLAGDPSGGWTWPARGVLTQPFGPSSLALEPPYTYDGVTFPHFHPAVDLAAPLLTPVLAAAGGRVSFVGHFSDGAMVVLLAHASGYVTLYAHLDDGLRPPLVRVGDTVSAGEPIGAIGLTGVTTGAHLHFEVLQGSRPVDPLSVLPPR